MRVVVLTTSWPRTEREFAGRFVADAVERLRERGVEVEVLAPGAGYRDFGLAYGGGIAANLRRRPWAAPLMLLSMWRAVRRAAPGADLVHAHWLLTAVVARFGGKPFVVTLHGSGSAGRFSDVELARRRPRLVHALLRRASAVICVSETVAAALRSAGVDVVVIPNGVRVPAEVGASAEPPEVLYVGRLSPEKNVDTLVEAVGDLNLVVAGDGPLRERVPNALGAVPHAEVERLLERASVVVAPCEREGFGLAAAEAMAFGRPVVAAAGGALLELVADGETGLLVPPRDAAALREAVERLLGDRELRERLGRAARERARERFGWDGVIERTLEVYRRAVDA
ncbi:MAG: glycosyltransferase family 4 protein [Actinobacteria bacterium]|nr:MAG: glycosyltransferase family 4 protein [Actinomycetota bacterium]